ncbi:pregnancy zone protein-like [Hyperolius riggenbachi]|uniref:pregnancy zone protein-like n=1 Tax=Hyperolius riggenbachi TaxID=752182 RepID=UPI0035A2D517
MRLFILGFLAFIAGGFSEPQCSVSILSLLKSGETGTACLMLKRYTEEMNVNVTLEVDDQEHSVILEQFTPGGDIFKCYDFQVPKLKNPSPVFLLVNAHSGNYNYTSRRSVVIAPSGNIAFIQTDKYLYKKSQTVHIYVMSVDDNLRPVDEMLLTLQARPRELLKEHTEKELIERGLPVFPLVRRSHDGVLALLGPVQKWLPGDTGPECLAPSSYVTSDVSTAASVTVRRMRCKVSPANVMTRAGRCADDSMTFEEEGAQHPGPELLGSHF